jgi:hypothetical protein
MSAFSVADTDAVAYGVRILTEDLESGLWVERYGHLGYRFVCV